MLLQASHRGFSLSGAFSGVAAEQPQQSSQLSTMARVTGINFTANLPNVSATTVNTTNTSLAGLDSQLDQANGAKANITEAAGKFDAALKNVQNVLYDTIADVAKDQGLNGVAAAAAVGPAPQTTLVDAVAAVGSDMAFGGPISSSMTALNTLSHELQSLNDEQRSRLLAEVHARLTPSQDFVGQSVAPQVESDYDFSGITPDEIQQLLLPPALHPEGKTILDARKHVEQNILSPLEGSDPIATINEGDTAKNLEPFIQSGMNVAEFVDLEVLQEVAPELVHEEEFLPDDDRLTAGEIISIATLSDTAGLMKADAGVPASAAYNAVKATLAPVPAPVAEAAPAVNQAAAAPMGFEPPRDPAAANGY
jgi:hypothetical protein